MPSVAEGVGTGQTTYRLPCADHYSTIGKAASAATKHSWASARTVIGALGAATIWADRSARCPAVPARRATIRNLRAGLVKVAAMAGVRERSIKQQTGHKNTAMLRRYMPEGALFRKHAATAVGLAGPGRPITTRAPKAVRAL